jgi:putative tryptophan/tyrosine transport system substrate-binding protein
MKRREILALLASAAIMRPQEVLAQVTRRRPLVAWLTWGSSYLVLNRRNIGLFLADMRELHYTEGRDFEMVYRSAEGHADRLSKLTAELVQLNPDIIIAQATIEAVAVSKVTTTIPIVCPFLAEPVELGFAASDARPSGNVTGISPYVKGLPAKQLELAREIVPGAARVGLLDDVTDPKARPQRREIDAAGRELKVSIVAAEVRTAGDIGPAYEALATERVEVVVVEQSTLLIAEREQIAAAAAVKKLPSVYGYREHVDAGGLISYGVNVVWCVHRVGYYVDRILKGAKPADLPVEFPTKLELVINLKTAKVLGLTIPPSLLARADEVIE